MIAQPPDGLDADVRADARELFPQEAGVDLHMILHGVGVKAPDALEQRLLRDVAALRLQQDAHDVKFPRRQAHAFAAAAQYPGREVEGRVAERQLVDLLPLSAQQRADAGQQLAGIKRLCQIIIRPGVQPGHAVHEIGLCSH